MARGFKQTAEFYNFICHFGNQELLDYLDEIVLPAFLNTSIMFRRFGKSRYFLLDVSLSTLTLGRFNHPALVGRFVVDTELNRDQVFEDGRLRESRRSMKSAPSSLFALLLDNHKLLYAREVSGGPSVAAFKTTIQHFLRKQRRNYIESLYDEARDKYEAGEGQRISRQTFYDAIPEPELEIVPLLGESSIREFVSRFSVLRELQIRILKTNNEIDNDGLFEDLRKARENINAESTTLVHRNPEGLRKQAAAKQASPAMHGNARVKFVGIGPNSERLSGSNEDFKVVSQPIEVPSDPKQAGALMLRVFSDLLSEGLIRLADSAMSPEQSAKIKRLLSR